MNWLDAAMSEALETAQTQGFDLWGTKLTGQCQSCGDDVGYTNLVLDHDHRFGIVRGYLCRSCNTSEGYGHTDHGIAEYLESPPAFQPHLPPLVYEGFGKASPLWAHASRCQAINRLQRDCGLACHDLRNAAGIRQ